MSNNNKPYDKSQKELKELDVQTRPELAPAPAPAPVPASVDSQALLLLKQLLDEANQVTRATDIFSTKATNGYRRLHAAFRTLMSLRGDEFPRGFALFQEAARAGRSEGIFHPLMQNRNLEFIQDLGERETFVIFMPLVTRYALAKDGQKAQFAQNNRVDRLLERVVDEELVGLLAAGFGVK